MSNLSYELLFLLLLILLNGLLAMAEMSLVSARKARLEQRVAKGELGARTALRLLEHPTRLLSSVQVGITMIGVLTGIIGGEGLADRLSALAAKVPLLAPYSETIGIALVVLRLVSLRAAALSVLVLAVGGAAALWLGASQLSGIQRVLVDLADVLKTGLPSDESTFIRLQMLQGGFKAFLQAPIFGHGPLDFAALANDLSDLPPGGWPHLHNDLADFAASAGMLGLVAFALFLMAPIVEVLRADVSKARQQALTLVSTLVAGYFVMGLTNAMFGILTVTTVYAAICVIAGILAAPGDEPGD